MTLAWKPEMSSKISPVELRSALSKFATGVTVLTANTVEGPVGITVNSFSSVSLDPPLVLFSLGKDVSRLAAFINQPHYAVHILKEDQADMCWSFSKSNEGFSQVETKYSVHGVPIFDECLARFELELTQKLDGGDHIIFLCRVLNTMSTNGDPLVFYHKKLTGIEQEIEN